MMRENGVMFWVLTGVSLLVFMILQSRVSVPGDMAWLSLAAESFLSGRSMTDAFMDNNPPLSYMIYLPVAIIVRAGIPLWTAGFLYGAALLLCSTFLIARLLKFFLVPGQLFYYAVIWAWLLSVTVFWQAEFANKDHLIALMLLPFLLAQYAITCGAKKSAVVRMALILCTPFILLKPHYGLLCVLILGHRFWKEGRISIIFDFDFMCLAIGTILYAAITLVWFPDFLAYVLPTVSLGMYVTLVLNDVLISFAGMGLFSVCLIIMMWFADGDKRSRDFTLFLGFMMLASTIPFVSQLKGFSLHMIPFISLAIPAVFLTALLYLKATQSDRRLHVVLLAGFLVLLSAGLMRALAASTHEDYRDSPLAAYISRHAEGSSFLMQSLSTNIVVPLSVYTGIPHATRFTSFWFLNLLDSQDNVSFFADLVAEDLERFQPAMVALYHDPAPEDDMLKLFAGSERFAEVWGHYYKSDEIAVDSYEFYKRKGVQHEGYPVYDVYLRK